MTELREPTSRHEAAPRSSSTRRVLVPCALVLFAAALAVSDAPSIVRAAVVLPVLILVPGWAVTVLLVGRANDAPERLVRMCMCPLLGSLLLLAVVLALGAGGVAITGDTVAGFGAAAAVVSVLGAEWSTRHGRSATTFGRPPDARTVVLGAAAAVLLVTALVVAVKLQPEVHEKYTELVLTGPATSAPGQIHASAGADVQIRWARYSYGYSLPQDLPVVDVTIAGASVVDEAATTEAPEPVPDATTDVVDSQTGKFTVAAPEKYGTYRVSVTVSDADAPDLQAAGNSTLVMYLEVGR
ncbi:hypothetical protein [Rhodococcoides yunnanense]|uniref:hypothetical protein n=1 Tax=Rhodococcoides yunnanense TaxID=278209 RepID=UPI000934EFD8|nr:hypothetical protein [Rhodococcus yunnanensis]